jgi:hypothetical protein
MRHDKPLQLRSELTPAVEPMRGPGWAGSRRVALGTASAGFGLLAFAGLSSFAAAVADGAATDTTNPLAPKAPHFPARAKRVIFLCMQGAPSHVDTFDYKPRLQRDHGKPGRYGGQLLGSQWAFHQHGESGLWISDLFPELSRHADELCLINSMHCDQPVHPAAQTQMHTGTSQFVRPSLGAWTLYGLGTENDSLPGFVSLGAPPGTSRNVGSAFLPAVYSGTSVGRTARGQATVGPLNNMLNRASIPDIRNPRLNVAQQTAQLSLIQALNREKLARHEYYPEVEAVIESYELAFRMQDSLPALLDISGETAETVGLYGAEAGPTSPFGRQCLMARRCVEAGVRFIEITHGGWDHHRNISQELPDSCGRIDKPIAGLLEDLKRRDLLKDTLVMWGGEFGRTPAAQGGNGRDHNNKGYTLWMAGGGVRGGIRYGATDEHGYEALEDRCHVHDWHATILHLLGLDHQRLTYRYAGRDFRLTDVHGNVQAKIIAG